VSVQLSTLKHTIQEMQEISLVSAAGFQAVSGFARIRQVFFDCLATTRCCTLFPFFPVAHKIEQDGSYAEGSGHHRSG
jgi:hypothetical protein